MIKMMNRMMMVDHTNKSAIDQLDHPQKWVKRAHLLRHQEMPRHSHPKAIISQKRILKAMLNRLPATPHQESLLLLAGESLLPLLADD